MARAGAAVLPLLAGACVPAEGPMMRPFEDCLGCHGKGEGKAWTVAGTWAKGARVSVTDANGKTVPMRGNDAGNFYTAEGLAFPLTVSVNGMPMPDIGDPTRTAKVTYGGCNLCHRAEQITIEFGPLMLPGADCLACHGVGGMAATGPATTFSAAGTFPPPGPRPPRKRRAPRRPPPRPKHRRSPPPRHPRRRPPRHPSPSCT